MSLYVDETGTPGAASIVFLHGIGASGWMWTLQTAALADFHCLNVDLPGHGKSNQIPWVSLADTAEQLAAVIRGRATHGRAHIVGLSLGAHVALALLERDAGLADRVVISGITAAPWPNRSSLGALLWLPTGLLKRRGFVDRPAKSLGLSPAMQAAFIENLQAMSMDTYRRVYTEGADYSVSPALRLVPTPTLVTAGGNETKIIVEAVGAVVSLMPNAQGRLAPGRGHGWNVEAPALFNAMVRAWITGAPLPAGLQTTHGG